MNKKPPTEDDRHPLTGAVRINITGPMAERLRALFGRMLANERTMHLSSTKGCALYLVNLGAQKLEEELDRDE